MDIQSGAGKIYTNIPTLSVSGKLTNQGSAVP